MKYLIKKHLFVEVREVKPGAAAPSQQPSSDRQSAKRRRPSLKPTEDAQVLLLH